MTDPDMVARVLAEEWDVQYWHSTPTIRFGGGDTAERVRQIMLARRLLREVAEYADGTGSCFACWGSRRQDDCPVCAIVAELRGGK